MGYFTSYQISQKNATLYVTCCIWHSVPLSLFLKKLFLPYMSPNTLRSRFSQSFFSGKKCWVKFGAVMDFPQYSTFHCFFDFFIASIQCVSDFKKDFVVVIVLDAELLSNISQNWIVIRLEKIAQYGSFIPDYS